MTGLFGRKMIKLLWSIHCFVLLSLFKYGYNVITILLLTMVRKRKWRWIDSVSLLAAFLPEWRANNARASGKRLLLMGGVIVAPDMLLSKLIGCFLFDLGLGLIIGRVGCLCRTTNLHAVCSFLLESHLFDIVVLWEQILLLTRFMPSVDIIVILIVLKRKHFWVYMPIQFVFPSVCDSLSEWLLQIDVLQNNVVLIVVVEHWCILNSENVLLADSQFIRWMINFHPIQLMLRLVLSLLLLLHFLNKL